MRAASTPPPPPAAATHHLRKRAADATMAVEAHRPHHHQLQQHPHHSHHGGNNNNGAPDQDAPHHHHQPTQPMVDFSTASLYLSGIQTVFAICTVATVSVLAVWLVPAGSVSAVRTLVLCVAGAVLLMRHRANRSTP